MESLEINWQQLIGLTAFLIGFAGTVSYLRSIFRGQSKPHLFTWLIWGTITTIGLAAQIYGHAGPGKWAMAITAASCFLVAGLSLKYGEKNITRFDWIALIASLSAILPWLLTKDPLGSVILISLIDVVAFLPTFRKSWHKPQEEHLNAYLIANLKFILSLFAITDFTVITALYPIAVIAANSAFVLMCYWRRRYINKAQSL